LKDLSKAQRFFLPTRVSSNSLSIIFKAIAAVILRPWLYKVMIRLAPALLPLPLEAYLKFHFSKVRKQTILYMKDYIAQQPDPRLKALLLRIESV